MIVSNRKYPFGSRVARIATSAYTLMISTAKEGLFEKQSTMVFELATAEADKGRPIAKFMWSSALRSGDRVEMHDKLVTTLDGLGTQGTDIGLALEYVTGTLRKAGLIESAYNLMVDGD